MLGVLSIFGNPPRGCASSTGIWHPGWKISLVVLPWKQAEPWRRFTLNKEGPRSHRFARVCSGPLGEPAQTAGREKPVLCSCSVPSSGGGNKMCCWAMRFCCGWWPCFCPHLPSKGLLQFFWFPDFSGIQDCLSLDIGKKQACACRNLTCPQRSLQYIV